MPAIPLKVTRAPSGDVDQTAVEAAKPLFRGTGDTDYLCGNCGAVSGRRWNRGRVREATSLVEPSAPVAAAGD